MYIIKRLLVNINNSTMMMMRTEQVDSLIV